MKYWQSSVGNVGNTVGHIVEHTVGHTHGEHNH